MFRFTIRDLLWMMVVVAVCCAWFLHVRSIRMDELRRSEKLLKYSESALNETREQYEKARRDGIPLPPLPATPRSR